MRKDFRHVIVYTNKTFQEDIFKMNNVDQKAVNAIRVLSADAIQKANSGHPGLPLGAAPMAYELWAHHMKHNPADPELGEP